MTDLAGAASTALVRRIAKECSKVFDGDGSCMDEDDIKVARRALSVIADWLDDHDIQATAVGVANRLREEASR